jgi:hypothetical protein
MRRRGYGFPFGKLHGLEPVGAAKKSEENYCCDGQEVLFAAAILKKQTALTEQNFQETRTARSIFCVVATNN